MDKEEVSVNAAARIAKQPVEEQKRIVALPAPERKAEVRKLRVQIAASKLLPVSPPLNVTERKPLLSPVPQFEVAKGRRLIEPDPDDAVSMHISCNPERAAAALIRHWLRDDLVRLVAALNRYLEAPIQQ